MKLFRKTLESSEKHIPDDHEEYCPNDDDSDSDVEDADQEIGSQRLSFKERCANLEQKMANVMEELRNSTNGKSLQQSCKILKQNQRKWLLVEDQWALCSWGHMTTIFLKIFYIMGYNLKNARNGKSILKIPKWQSLRSLALRNEIL